MRIESFLNPQDIITDLPVGSKEQALRTIAEQLIRNHTNLNADLLYQVLLKRENLRSTGIEDGVAFPHGSVPGLDKLIAFFARCREGLNFNSFDGKPTHFFFVLLIPENSQGTHLKALARLNKLLQKAEVRRRLLEAADAEEIWRIVTQEDAGD